MFKKKIVVMAALMFVTSVTISQEYSTGFQSRNFQFNCTKIGEDGSNKKIGEDGSNAKIGEDGSNVKIGEDGSNGQSICQIINIEKEREFAYNSGLLK